MRAWSRNSVLDFQEIGDKSLDGEAVTGYMCFVSNERLVLS